MDWWIGGLMGLGQSRVVNRRWVIVAVLACVVAAIVIAFVWPREREPEYGGKRLSESVSQT